ncbi:MAG: AmmeMemoRadiSam system protein A [Chitinophagales bacterium]
MIVYGALSPHPPLIIPAIGGGQISQVEATVQGMRNLASEVVKRQPETLVFFTPHGNVFQDAVSVLAEKHLEGDFGGFGKRDIKYSYDNDLELLIKISGMAGEENIPLVLLDRNQDKYRLNYNLDHGILVPLHYLKEAGLTEVKILAISVAWLGLEKLYRFGMLVQKAADQLGRKVAIIASGDMSHRLTQDGPYDYNPDGAVFDKRVRDILAEGQVLPLFEIPEELKENAGECGFRSIIMLMGAMNGWKFNSQVYSYEGPLGVGYLVAGFVPEEAAKEDIYKALAGKKEKARSARRMAESSLVSWARQCLEMYVEKGQKAELPKPLPEELDQRAAAFVSLKIDGRLRGCIGTLRPVRPNLGIEILENAISAGTQDYRFLPVSQEELDEIDYSVDVLGEPEKIDSMSELDPKRYGVIVHSGSKTGVLLPDLPGIDDPEEQVDIACQKAGIRKGESFNMERFEVKRYH